MCPHFPQARRGLLDGYKLLVTEDGDALELHSVFVSALWPLDENEGAKEPWRNLREQLWAAS